MYLQKSIVPFKDMFLIFSILGITADIFLLSGNFDITKIVLIILWLLTSVAYSFKSNFAFIIAFSLVIMLALFYLFVPERMFLEKIATWSVIFMVIGSVMQIRELRA